jgi:hypothetical protein
VTLSESAQPRRKAFGARALTFFMGLQRLPF